MSAGYRGPAYRRPLPSKSPSPRITLSSAPTGELRSARYARSWEPTALPLQAGLEERGGLMTSLYENNNFCFEELVLWLRKHVAFA